MDLETFKILVKDFPSKNRFTFKGIYSDKYAMNADSIHGDKDDPPPEHPIKYYFATNQHPVVFVNTSNHAMAEHDTNHRIWKVEYVPWLENAPLKLDNKPRDQIDKRFKWIKSAQQEVEGSSPSGPATKDEITPQDE